MVVELAEHVTLNRCDVCFRDRPNLFFFDLLKCLKMGASVVTHGCPTPQVGPLSPCHMLMTKILSLENK